MPDDSGHDPFGMLRGLMGRIEELFEVGQILTFRPNNSHKITTLTKGNQYTVMKVTADRGDDGIYIMNDRGMYRWYNSTNFIVKKAQPKKKKYVAEPGFMDALKGI